ncbi:hypothetical protein Tco_0228150 [Tanacetum coccineum]
MADHWKSMDLNNLMTMKTGYLKDDKGKLTRIKIVDDLEKRIRNIEIELNKAKENMLKERGNSSFDLSRWSKCPLIYLGSYGDAFNGCQLLAYLVEAADVDAIKDFDIIHKESVVIVSDDTWEQRTIFKGKPGSSSTSFQGKKASSSKLLKAKSKSSSKSLSVLSSSKHLTPSTGSSSNPYQTKLRSSSKDV